MKQKYTLSIADMEINVVTDEPQESVERIVGILDRKIREISLKSKRCSKNEAALLCALDFCADKVKTKEVVEELEEQAEELEEQVKGLNEKLEYIQKNVERLENERARLEVENSRLRSILDDMRAGKAAPAEVAPVEVQKPVGDIYATEEAVAAEVEEAEEKPAKLTPAQKKKGTGKNRVGSMFDLLTFSDV
jgi:cell division protein ZapA (FtsZ GTPase activity inhibitor)